MHIAKTCARLALFAALPLPAFAINGMYLTGYGNESMLMGGADVAVARDAFAANNNPAGMSQLRGQAADLEIALEHDLDLSHDDIWNNHKPRHDHYAGYGNMAYARRLEQSPLSVGAALVIQGGLGWTYSGMNVNPALGGGRDDTSALFAVVKLAPAMAWQVNDQLSVGAAMGINYFAGQQELFPNTSCVACLGGQPFFGFRFKNASGIGVNGKLGLQYKPSEDVTIGFTYGTKTSIPMKGGDLRINMSSAGLGVVRYDDARLDGFRLPEEFALGIAFRPFPSLLVSLQEKRYGWAKALNRLSIVATNPRTPGAPPQVVIPATVGFKDQDVIALGIAWDYSPDTTILAGYNYNKQVIPSRYVTPLFIPIPSRHFDIGFSHVIDKEWVGSAGLELFLPQTATYDSPIFGPGASEHNFTSVFHLAIGRRW